MKNFKIANIFKGDKVIWMLFFFLCIISIVEVYSASSTLANKGAAFYAAGIRHTGFVIAGFLVAIVISHLNYSKLRWMVGVMMLFSIIILLWALLGGHSENDASRWVNLFGIKFQPSEIAKGSLIVYVAQILSLGQTDKGAEKGTFLYVCIGTVIIIGLIILENFSTAALLGLVVVMMMFIGRIKIATLGKLLGVVFGIVAFVVMLTMLIGKDVQPQNNEQQLTETAKIEKADKQRGVLHRFDTWKSRIDKFLNKEDVPADSFDIENNTQAGYSKIAIVNSNIIGVGPGNSEARQTLPQAYSDFIFAIIIEELGLIGAFFVILLYIILLFRSARIANQCNDYFSSFLIMGLTLLIVTQAMFNICVAVGLAPITGQPLPLISRGGTSTLINCGYMGIILGISNSIKRKKETKNIEQ